MALLLSPNIVLGPWILIQILCNLYLTSMINSIVILPVTTLFCLFSTTQIKWKNHLLKDNGSICKVTVDGTDFQVQRFLPYDKDWNSHKFAKKQGVQYEVAISIQAGNDISIFRSGLKSMLKNGERVEADKGYIGEPYYVDLPDKMSGRDSGQHKRKYTVRSRHETCNKRFKQFNCLKNFFNMIFKIMSKFFMR